MYLKKKWAKWEMHIDSHPKNLQRQGIKVVCCMYFLFLFYFFGVSHYIWCGWCVHFFWKLPFGKHNEFWRSEKWAVCIAFVSFHQHLTSLHYTVFKSHAPFSDQYGPLYYAGNLLAVLSMNKLHTFWLYLSLSIPCNRNRILFEK